MKDLFGNELSEEPIHHVNIYADEGEDSIFSIISKFRKTFSSWTDIFDVDLIKPEDSRKS